MSYAKRRVNANKLTKEELEIFENKQKRQELRDKVFQALLSDDLNEIAKNKRNIEILKMYGDLEQQTLERQISNFGNNINAKKIENVKSKIVKIEKYIGIDENGNIPEDVSQDNIKMALMVEIDALKEKLSSLDPKVMQEMKETALKNNEEFSNLINAYTEYDKAYEHFENITDENEIETYQQVLIDAAMKRKEYVEKADKIIEDVSKSDVDIDKDVLAKNGFLDEEMKFTDKQQEIIVNPQKRQEALDEILNTIKANGKLDNPHMKELIEAINEYNEMEIETLEENMTSVENNKEKKKELEETNKKIDDLEKLLGTDKDGELIVSSEVSTIQDYYKELKDKQATLNNELADGQKLDERKKQIETFNKYVETKLEYEKCQKEFEQYSKLKEDMGVDLKEKIENLSKAKIALEGFRKNHDEIKRDIKENEVEVNPEMIEFYGQTVMDANDKKVLRKLEALKYVRENSDIEMKTFETNRFVQISKDLGYNDRAKFVAKYLGIDEKELSEEKANAYKIFILTDEEKDKIVKGIENDKRFSKYTQTAKEISKEEILTELVQDKSIEKVKVKLQNMYNGNIVNTNNQKRALDIEGEERAIKISLNEAYYSRQDERIGINGNSYIDVINKRLEESKEAEYNTIMKKLEGRSDIEKDAFAKSYKEKENLKDEIKKIDNLVNEEKKKAVQEFNAKVEEYNKTHSVKRMNYADTSRAIIKEEETKYLNEMQNYPYEMFLNEQKMQAQEELDSKGLNSRSYDIMKHALDLQKECESENVSWTQKRRNKKVIRLIHKKYKQEQLKESRRMEKLIESGTLSDDELQKAINEKQRFDNAIPNNLKESLKDFDNHVNYYEQKTKKINAIDKAIECNKEFDELTTNASEVVNNKEKIESLVNSTDSRSFGTVRVQINNCWLNMSSKFNTFDINQAVEDYQECSDKAAQLDEKLRFANDIIEKNMNQISEEEKAFNKLKEQLIEKTAKAQIDENAETENNNEVSNDENEVSNDEEELQQDDGAELE